MVTDPPARRASAGLLGAPAQRIPLRAVRPGPLLRLPRADEITGGDGRRPAGRATATVAPSPRRRRWRPRLLADSVHRGGLGTSGRRREPDPREPHRRWQHVGRRRSWRVRPASGLRVAVARRRQRRRLPVPANVVFEHVARPWRLGEEMLRVTGPAAGDPVLHGVVGMFGGHETGLYRWLPGGRAPHLGGTAAIRRRITTIVVVRGVGGRRSSVAQPTPARSVAATSPGAAPQEGRPKPGLREFLVSNLVLVLSPSRHRFSLRRIVGNVIHMTQAARPNTTSSSSAAVEVSTRGSSRSHHRPPAARRQKKLHARPMSTPHGGTQGLTRARGCG